ncbi:hypothetical protein [Streptomyces sp. NWU339]|uniref:telomere-protecting terminal protein Tpg n=1 Tax=Streptomyces sp. NWU339 TaxID=2185284 RepID=UPI0015E8079D|nr:hypothetical protein [Streptomyces sp. NWU339]
MHEAAAAPTRRRRRATRHPCCRRRAWSAGHSSRWCSSSPKPTAAGGQEVRSDAGRTREARARRARWQPRVRAQARRQAATRTGLVVDTRARFGFTAASGTTDDARIRHLTLTLPPQDAARLFDAQGAGATEQQLRILIGEALGEVYFRDGGSRAHGLAVEFTDVEHVEFDL